MQVIIILETNLVIRLVMLLPHIFLMKIFVKGKLVTLCHTVNPNLKSIHGVYKKMQYVYESGRLVHYLSVLYCIY